MKRGGPLPPDWNLIGFKQGKLSLENNQEPWGAITYNTYNVIYVIYYIIYYIYYIYMYMYIYNIYNVYIYIIILYIYIICIYITCNTYITLHIHVYLIDQSTA